MTASDTPGPVTETARIGNPDASSTQVSFSSNTAVATYIGVRWDGDKVRGIRIKLSDGTQDHCGGIDDDGYQLTEYNFAAGETLAKAWLRDSGYGHGSVRQIEFLTSTGNSFKAGPDHFDSEVSLIVDGFFLVGFHAWVNSDNFINALAFMVRSDAPTKPPVYRPWFETNSVGNPGAASNQVSSAADHSTALYIAVRWDGDKVRGLSMTMRDGTVTSAGGIGDVDYNLSSYTFVEDEVLQTLSFSSSGYGYGSLRRIEFTTNKGQFAAGPDGIDDLVTPPVAGAVFVGFHAWVNPDNFINAIAFRVTDDAPYDVTVRNFSPWSTSYSNGVVTIDGRGLIEVADIGTNVSGVPGTLHKRGVQITAGDLKGYLAFDGSADLTISIFADATFEAKFKLDEGDGAVYGPIDGLAPSTSKPWLVEALVRKYAPIYTLNVDEAYWQSDVDTFLPHTILQTVSNGVPSNFYTGTMDRDVLAKQASALGGNNTNTGACLRTSADLDQPSDTQDWFNGTRATTPSQLTTYAVVIEGQNGKLDIVYWWFFNYNQGKTVASTSWGNHVADWEHVKVHVGGVDFARPQNEQILGIMYDHHGNQETHPPNDGTAELHGRQVLVHLANGDHECYPKAGTYLLDPAVFDNHDYCKENPYYFDTPAGNVEIYSWDGSDFAPIPPGATAAFRDPTWIRYHGRWGNWQRGVLNLFGEEIAQLESGPEGLFRPGEYSQPK